MPLRQCQAEERRAKSLQNSICLEKTWCSAKRCFGVGKVMQGPISTQFSGSTPPCTPLLHPFALKLCAVLKAEMWQRLLPVEVSSLKKMKRKQWRSSLLTCALAAEFHGLRIQSIGAIAKLPASQCDAGSLAE